MSDKKFLITIYIIFTIFVCIFTSNFLNNEDKIYSCNFVMSNQMFFRTFEQLNENFFAGISNILRLVAEAPFNPLHILPLFPFYYMFGNSSRFGFIIGIELFYMIPITLLLLYYLYKEIIHYDSKYKLMNIAVLISVLFMPALWFPSLRGQAEIITFIPVFLMIIYFSKINFEENNNIRNALLLGLSMYLVFILRRFFIVFDAAIVLTIFLFGLNRIIKNRTDSIKKLINLGLNSIIIPSCMFLGLMCVFQFPYIISCLETKDIVIKAYVYRNCFETIISCFYLLGYKLILLILALISVFLWADKNTKKNITFLTSILFFYTCIFSFYLFIDIYLNLILVFISVIIISGFYYFALHIKQTRKNNILPNLLSAIFILYIIFSFLYFFNTLGYNIKKFPKYPTIEYITSTPYKFSYIVKKSIKEIDKTLKEEIKNNPDAKITVYATLDETMSYFILESYSTFTDKILLKHLNPTSEYFSNEGIPNQNLNADFVVVSDPVRFEERKKGFLPLFNASEAFLNSENIGKSYTCIKEISFYVNRKNNKAEKVTLYIFKKTKPVTPEQVNELYNSIIEEVPQFADIYKNKMEEYKNFYEINTNK